ncbi:ferredoxin-type protein NapF [Ottowia sp. SB7-C50]|uniref:ferredoxin-type protein NapF n=1 Tax=Ottowia sp. SB7-C50 TaxID=3081231 RepID=UPI002954BEB0|nr:ferredoxin-type protein NapF [Ottowia sp. SB7-C50]WOP15094.1 ferredoxin-type protein NapF [Ottowia sp. SB7-C50]
MVDPRRRSFLRGRMADAAAPQAPVVQRPPWAVAEARFTEQCVRCHACVEGCPRHVLKVGDGGFPEVDFSAQGCDFCGACEAACEPQALNRPAAEAAQAGTSHAAWPGWQVRIAPHCLALQKVECRICADACAPRAIRFRPAPGGISQMQLDLAACTACGECVAVCPVGAAMIGPRQAA